MCQHAYAEDRIFLILLIMSNIYYGKFKDKIENVRRLFQYLQVVFVRQLQEYGVFENNRVLERPTGDFTKAARHRRLPVARDLESWKSKGSPSSGGDVRCRSTASPPIYCIPNIVYMEYIL
ncbi:hypothetical protein EVAR_9808_1 [Eumeta japonica]|uniref:Uncharacterized protein n=1 Tax=Eumeta variegata TaxID=151549 RepID=A0A4C1U5G0_EUMVA|nr:hypothetical protein EVAR_9808_1 [Eumeta japonica]